MKWRRVEAGDYRAEDGGYTLRVRRDGEVWRTTIRRDDATGTRRFLWRLLPQAKRAAEAAAETLHEAPLRAPAGWRGVGR